jgi:hypothetical protein
VTISGGTGRAWRSSFRLADLYSGKFTGFQAHADVSTDSDGLWHWEGTYSFEAEISM